MASRAIAERFWEKTDRSGGPDSCWPWIASHTTEGYGQFFLDGKLVLAHRVAYELVHGSIPKGTEIDHCRANGCTRKDCQNAVRHLEAVPHVENVRRGDAGKAAAERESSKTHCPAGHPYFGDNLYVAPKTGARHCRVCRKEASLRLRDRRTADG